METEITPIRILVVEDDRNVAAVLKGRLQTYGYQVCDVIHTGPAAVKSALEHRPDIVLMDILLDSEMNGLEAAELIHSQIDVPIVFITCLRDQHILDRALKTCAYGYILKPYENAELRYTLEIALIKHRSAKQREELIHKLEHTLSERQKDQGALRAANESLEQKVIERTRLLELRSKQLQALAVELMEAEERERLRISDLLHDDLQQVLAAARLHLEEVCKKMPDQTLLHKVEQMLSDCISKTRSLSHQLSPVILRQADPVAALKWLCKQMEEHFGLKCHFRADIKQPLYSKPLHAFIVRAVQELLFNVVKHSAAKSARVALTSTEKNIQITVSDEGQGFNTDLLESAGTKDGLGLMSVRERANYFGGSFDISSSPGKGSRFTISLPIILQRRD